MKKRGTVFWSTIFLLLPIVMLMNIVLLATAYQITYKQSYEHCTQDVITAAKVVEDFVGMYDLDDPEDVAQCNDSLSALCREFNITYAYVQEIDAEKNTETYLALGVGNNASKDFIHERKTGDVVTDQLTKEQIDAANGKEYTIYRLRNKFDDTIVCNVPLLHVYDDAAKTFKETANANNRIVAAELSFSVVMESFQHSFRIIGIGAFALSIVLVLAFALVLHHRIAKPVRNIQKSMTGFAKDHEAGFKKLEVRGNNEFSEMARVFNQMADEMERYIQDIKTLNKERHMQEAELNIAKDIQLGLLPHQTYRNNDVNIDAYILPAKNVGGDFYDYHILNDGTVVFAIADVSGKGIAAAMFVSHALTLLSMFTQMNMSPAKIMEEYNNTLAKKNPNGLFITTFLAAYHPDTGKMVYTNAGHNIPYLLSEGKLIALDGACGMATGIFSGETYEEATVQLKHGDTVFAYTDGVNEAQNERGALLGIPALEAELRTQAQNGTVCLIDDVLKRVRDFTGGADQSDDITIITLKTQGAFYHKELTLESRMENLRTVMEEIENLPDISTQLRLELQLIAEEIFVNICHYAYGEKQGDICVKFNVCKNVEIEFIDSGTPFNPTRNLLDIEEYDHEHTVGGLGRFITFQTADEYVYYHKKGQNHLLLTKYIDRSQSQGEEE